MEFSQLKKYTKNSFLNLNWEKDAQNLLAEDKFHFNLMEKEKLKFLLSLVRPSLENRKKVRRYKNTIY